MNFFELVKQFKSFKLVMEEVKEELRRERGVLEKEGVEIVFNGLGEILSIEFKEEKSCEEAKEILIELINQAQDISRDKMKEVMNRRFGGLLEGFGLGL